MSTEKPDCRLRRVERLRGRSRLEKLFADGRSGFSYPFRYVWMEGAPASNEGDGVVAVMASAPKRNHKRANVRNTIKRRTREAYRLNKELLTLTVSQRGKSISLALIYSSKQVEEYKTVENAIRKILAEVASKLG